jgi:hypothetical protein
MRLFAPVPPNACTDWCEQEDQPHVLTFIFYIFKSQMWLREASVIEVKVAGSLFWCRDLRGRRSLWCTSWAQTLRRPAGLCRIVYWLGLLLLWRLSYVSDTNAYQQFALSACQPDCAGGTICAFSDVMLQAKWRLCSIYVASLSRLFVLL